MNNHNVNTSNENALPIAQIKNELEKKIKYLESFFDYFHLNVENFSKSLQNDINLIAPLIKNNEDVFTVSIKDKLIFISENISNESERKFKSDSLKLDLINQVLKKMNLELSSYKDKMKSLHEEGKKMYKRELNDVIMDKVINEYDSIEKKYLKEWTNWETINDSGIKKEDINPFISKINIMKKEIDDIHNQNEILLKEKNELKEKLTKFNNLPTDINQIKKLIEIKKEEYKALTIKKKNTII